MDEVRRRSVRQDGNRLFLSDAGPVDGPPVVLLHGIASDSGTWTPALPALADRGLRVIAPDLLGHGDSDKPAAGAYSLAGFAASVDALLDALALPDATLVGHSLGGAVAIHFGHHYPGRARRLVLVSSGGLGRDVHLALRAAALPVAPPIMRALVNQRTARWYRTPRLHRTLRLTPDNVTNLSRAGRTLTTSDGQGAFFATLRSVIGPSGQRGSMIELDWLARTTPTLIVWSEHDHVIPVRHAHDLHAHLPGSRLEVLPGGGHEPHRRHADRFADVVADFVAST